jgi:uncharacterized cupin superfamily protein
MSNLHDPLEPNSEGLKTRRLAEAAGSEYLGSTLYELAPGQEMVFHYHLQREELLIVLDGHLELRTATGWRTLPAGEVVAFPRGERGAHGYRNTTDKPTRLLMISEMDGPNLSVYPDTNQIGIFDTAKRSERRFGALFNLKDAASDYGGGEAELTPPAPGPSDSPR